MKSTGFTFIEMLIAVSMIAVLAAFSLPSFTSLLQRNEGQVVQQQLRHALQFAQQEARLRYTNIGVCQSDDGENCGGEWKNGQLVFVDDYDDGIIHTRDQIIQALQSSGQHGQLHWHGYPRYRTYVQFVANGLLNNDDGTFWYCASFHAKPTWALVLNKAGRIHVVLPDNKGDIHDSYGATLTCPV